MKDLNKSSDNQQPNNYLGCPLETSMGEHRVHTAHTIRLNGLTSNYNTTQLSLQIISKLNQGRVEITSS